MPRGELDDDGVGSVGLVVGDGVGEGDVVGGS